MNVSATTGGKHKVAAATLAHFHPAHAVNLSPAHVRPPTWLRRIDIDWRLTVVWFFLYQPLMIDPQRQRIPGFTASRDLYERQRNVERAVIKIYILEIAKRVGTCRRSWRETERSSTVCRLLLRENIRGKHQQK